MADLGAGLCPIGVTGVGYGTPYTLNSTAAKLFLDASGVQRNAAQIDPRSGDMVRGPDGIHRGMDSTGQQVYLALRTARGSVPIKNFGFGFVSKTIDSTTTQKIQDAVRLALAPLTQRGLITLDEVTVVRSKTNAVEVSVKWTNTTNAETNTTLFNPA